MTTTQMFWVRMFSRMPGLTGKALFLIIPVFVVLSWVKLGPVWLVFPVVFSLAVAYIALSLWAQRQREQYIREAPMPRFLKKKLLQSYPHFSAKDCDLVERGLRQFFLACSRSKKKFVAMPSKAVDAMWHEFILHTKGYEAWCSLALGHFLHHTPAEALGSKAKGNDGLRRAWYWACKDEAINPQKPSRLPLLFALDAKLAIANGFTYLPDCHDIARKNAQGGNGSADASGGMVYCGTSFSDGSHSSDSSSGDFGGADSADGSGSGGGGDGGGGDGGGGCGGGGD
jgi:hypothetical protein